MFTKEQLINIGAEKLADVILTLYENKPDIRKELDEIIVSFDSDPESNVSIKKEIISLKSCSCLSDYGSDSLENQIDKIRIRIMEDVLPNSPKQASELLLSLLDSQENSIERECYNDDSTVVDVFKQACADLSKVYERVTYSVEDIVKTVYDGIMSNDYGVYDDIILHFKELLGDEGLKQLKQKLEKSFEENEDKNLMARLGLQSIADFLNNVDAYIEACSFKNKLNDNDHFEIAKRLIKNKRYREAIKRLDKIESPARQNGKMALKVEALALCGDHQGVQTARQKWFDISLSPEVYNEIVNHSEARFIESWKKAAIRKSFKFKDSNVAVNFLIEIQELEEAAKLVYQKIDALNSSYELRPAADIFCKIHPLAATLLYRKMMEPYLDAKSNYFSNAPKDLAVCHTLSSKITNWQGFKNHQLYFEEISVLFERNRGFWSEYNSALNKQTNKTKQKNCRSRRCEET